MEAGKRIDNKGQMVYGKGRAAKIPSGLTMVQTNYRLKVSEMLSMSILKKMAVQIPIEAFEQIKEVLESHSLFQFIEENEGEESPELREAKTYYS